MWLNPSYQQRPYTLECTGSRLISEVNPVLAKVVLSWGTRWEFFVLLFCRQYPCLSDQYCLPVHQSWMCKRNADRCNCRRCRKLGCICVANRDYADHQFTSSSIFLSPVTIGGWSKSVNINNMYCSGSHNWVHYMCIKHDTAVEQFCVRCACRSFAFYSLHLLHLLFPHSCYSITWSLHVYQTWYGSKSRKRSFVCVVHEAYVATMLFTVSPPSIRFISRKIPAHYNIGCSKLVDHIITTCVSNMIRQ